MEYGKISTKQQEILDYIKTEIINRGYPPTVRDICNAVNLKSTSSVHSHLATLERERDILLEIRLSQELLRLLMIHLMHPDVRLLMFLLSEELLQANQFLQFRI